jgi:hypothetical protein
LKKIKDIVFIAALLVLIVLQNILKKYIIGNTITEFQFNILDLVFNLLLSFCLLGFYIKKYTADKFRIILMVVFFLELSFGIFLRKIKVTYGAEIMFIGFIGVLGTWYYTHKNRHRFISEEN